MSKEVGAGGRFDSFLGSACSLNQCIGDSFTAIERHKIRPYFTVTANAITLFTSFTFLPRP